MTDPIFHQHLPEQSQCPCGECDAPVRFAYNPHEQAYYVYHGEDVLVICPVGHLPPESFDRSGDEMALAIGECVGVALIKFHSEDERSDAA